jgi:hypothetical protein
VQRQAHGQCTANGPQVARQREFAGKFIAFQLAGVDLAAGRQDAQRDRQVEAAGVLGKVGRREVDGDSFVGREVQPGVLDGGAHAFAGLLDLGFGQPDQRETGQAVGQMHLDADGPRLQPQQGAAVH